jgi:hypothetical protein
VDTVSRKRRSTNLGMIMMQGPRFRIFRRPPQSIPRSWPLGRRVARFAKVAHGCDA